MSELVVWEFFAGSRSFSKVAEKKGMITYTTDIISFDNINQVCDIFDFDVDKAIKEVGKPHIIWFSPPCNKFSIASCYRHWDRVNDDYIPKSEGAILGLKILDKINALINELNPKYFIIENPRGLMRKMPQFQSYNRETVWYCQFGDKRAKPTDLWLNFDYLGKSCKNGNTNCHHERAPRGSKTGTQGLKNNYERSKIPEKLCHHILDTIINLEVFN